MRPKEHNAESLNHWLKPRPLDLQYRVLNIRLLCLLPQKGLPTKEYLSTTAAQALQF